MKCKACGAEVGVDDPLCLKCGNPTSKEAYEAIKAQKSLKTRLRKLGNKVHTFLYNHRFTSYIIGVLIASVPVYTLEYLIFPTTTFAQSIFLLVLEVFLIYNCGMQFVKWIRSF